MAIVRAFRATRFARLIPEVVAPPYDVIDESLRADLAERNPYNIVHLTLPQGGEQRYENAARLLQHWLAEGVLRRDDEPAIYRYTQRFFDPLTQTYRTRTGYFVLLHTEPYENGVVLPHEQTFPGVKEDRFRLLQATRTHLETIFGLFENTPAFQEAIADALWEPIAQVEGEELFEGDAHRLERLTNPIQVMHFERAFEDARVWIADGHHRYETALRFGQTYGTDGSPERFLPILLVPLDDPGLVILPTHRLLSELPPGSPHDWQARLSEEFEIDTVAPGAVVSQMAQYGGEAIGFVWREGAWLIRPKAYPPVSGQPDALTRLDSWVLHARVMPALGYHEPSKTYTRSAEEAIEAVRTGKAQAAFLLNPPPLSALQQIASAGGKMPHKSTYFYPKVLSGLILWQVRA
ncbi:MAG: hypothetical protein CFK49_04935 [Armatimonadetes bacterium JP3_11]|jgi:uncharacterized protein (DUF1015 family)|nr:MAG: hypothetical protein CFK48_02740 [Armatimonadetes bacterium CP1_7O]OYT75122.1 MAG: hypothetical protein CFK49_04935 [Armatimonadetes bacterium JP3_11]